jgi:glucan phosphoethanolaminetransferase (alkaline phosphatase superfamily)
MNEQPEDGQPPSEPNPPAPPDSPPEIQSEMPPEMTAQAMTSNELDEPKGIMSGFWGIIIYIILIGTVIGIFLWWIWVKSPLRTWLKVILTIIPIVILAIVV